MICGYLDKIKSSSEFLLGLINDMLDISRIESGNLNLKSEQMSREMFGTAINTTIGPLMEQKNITFRCDLQHMEEMIYTDAVRFKQIFFNLLSNAAKYTPEGGNVWLLTERPVSYTHLDVYKRQHWRWTGCLRKMSGLPSRRGRA